MVTRPHSLASLAMAAGVAFAFTGCQHIGPRTIQSDRSDYSSSISESWKRQTLLNIVKLRYLDPPLFVDVGQIVAGYSLETSVNAGGQISSASAIQGNSAIFGGSAKYTDRPTITYTPMTGNKFVKALMTPLPPESVFFVIESGWPADAILFATLARLNGLRNQEATISGLSPAEPRFLRALELFRKLQLSGTVGLRVEQDAQNHKTALVTFRSKDVTQETMAESRELRELLGLAPDANELKLVFGAVAANDHELAMQTRSIMHIMSLMGAQVEVPPEHITQGRATPGLIETDQQGTSPVRLARILSAISKPANAYVSVEYRDHWFWIDDRDLKSKRSFAFMLILFTLSETGEKDPMPLITIPAQ